MMPYLTRGWFLKGSKPVVKTVNGKGRISVFGALSKEDFSAQMTEEKCNNETYLQFLKSLLRKFGKVLIVVDGASYHFEKEHVQKFYEEKRDVLKVVQLPAYSPELNPIEQTWKKVKKLLAMSVWATKEEFEMKIAESLGNKDFRVKLYEYFLP
jgi:transposase